MSKVGSKLDRESLRVVQQAEGEALAAAHGSKYCEVSSKTRENVRKPFIEVVDQIVSTPHLMEGNMRRSGGSVLLGGQSLESSGGCSC